MPTDDSPTSTTLPAGHIVAGRYRVVRPLGRGGYGMVYEAEVAGAHHRVALKLIHAKLANEPSMRSRFLREAKLIQRVQHPNVVQLLDFGQHDDGRSFIALELLRGESLRQLLKRVRHLPLWQVAQISDKILSALDAAHRLGVVHRDIKPDNIFLCADPPGSLKVLDFGIAKAVAGQAPGTKLTETGDILGTPHYMAPEQIRGAADLDGRVDIYALGLLMAEMLCGHRLIVADSAIEVLMEHISDAPLELPPNLRASALGPVLGAALQKSPDARFASAAAMQVALRAAMQAAPSSVSTISAPALAQPFEYSPGAPREAPTRAELNGASQPQTEAPTRAMPSAPPLAEAAAYRPSAPPLAEAAARVSTSSNHTIEVSKRALGGLLAVTLLLVGALGGAAYVYLQRAPQSAKSAPAPTSTQPSPAAPDNSAFLESLKERSEVSARGIEFEQEMNALLTKLGCEQRERIVKANPFIYSVNLGVACKGESGPYDVIVYYADESFTRLIVQKRGKDGFTAKKRRGKAALIITHTTRHAAQRLMSKLLP